ncbi:MAG: short-chain dehydrogenase, partial [Oscillospiraceae bacterium]|nr:short-chain dehydrogenase [Oscillospiraceae bacterium]
MLANCADEERMGRFANSLPADSGQNLYYTTKYALSLWMRRHSVEWGMQ